MPELSEPQDENYPPIPEIIKTVSYLATFVIALFTARQFLPLEVYVALGLIFGISGVLFVLWIWRSPFRRYLKNRPRNRIARENYPQLVRFAERLIEFMAPGRETNPHYFLREMKGHVAELSSASIPESSYAQLLSWHLEEALKMHKPNLRGFVWGADSLTSLIKFYNEVYVLNPSKEIRAAMKKAEQDKTPDDLPAIPDHILERYNTVRVSFAEFLRQYEEFVTRINKQFGIDRLKAGDVSYDHELLRGAYFEPPKELENPLVAI